MFCLNSSQRQIAWDHLIRAKLRGQRQERAHQQLRDGLHAGAHEALHLGRQHRHGRAARDLLRRAAANLHGAHRLRRRAPALRQPCRQGLLKRPLQRRRWCRINAGVQGGTPAPRAGRRSCTGGNTPCLAGQVQGPMHRLQAACAVRNTQRRSVWHCCSEIQCGIVALASCQCACTVMLPQPSLSCKPAEPRPYNMLWM